MGDNGIGKAVARVRGQRQQINSLLAVPAGKQSGIVESRVICGCCVPVDDPCHVITAEQHVRLPEVAEHGLEGEWLRGKFFQLPVQSGQPLPELTIKLL